MQESDDAFDVLILIMVVAVFTPIMIYCSIPLFKGEVGGFNVQIEKTALETEREIVPVVNKITTNDVLLMLVVADRFTPQPKHINMNVQGKLLDIPLDESFLIDKVNKIQLAKAAMPNNIEVEIGLHAGPTGTRFWNVSEPKPKP